MRATRLSGTVAAGLLGLALGVAPLGAQTDERDVATPAFELAVGVSFNTPKDVNRPPLCTTLDLPCLSPRTFPDFGLVLQAVVQAIGPLAIAAEAGTYLDRWDTTAVGTSGEPRDNHSASLLVGPRLATGLLHLGSQDPHGFRAFAQLLAGPETATVLPTRVALQPGAGVDIRLPRPGLWFRGSLDYRWTHGWPRNLSGSRALFAIVAAR